MIRKALTNVKTLVGLLIVTLVINLLGVLLVLALAVMKLSGLL